MVRNPRSQDAVRRRLRVPSERKEVQYTGPHQILVNTNHIQAHHTDTTFATRIRDGRATFTKQTSLPHGKSSLSPNWTGARHWVTVSIADVDSPTTERKSLLFKKLYGFTQWRIQKYRIDGGGLTNPFPGRLLQSSGCTKWINIMVAANFVISLPRACIKSVTVLHRKLSGKNFQTQMRAAARSRPPASTRHRVKPGVKYSSPSEVTY